MAEQHLAAEYTACQYHIQTVDTRLWQSGAILIGASFTSLAVLAREEASTPICIALSLAALAAAVIFGLWLQLSLRRNATIEALETRMLEIESITGMRKVTYFHILRHWENRQATREWQNLAPEEIGNLERHYRPLPSKGATRVLFAGAALALAGWPALAIGKLIELATT